MAQEVTDSCAEMEKVFDLVRLQKTLTPTQASTEFCHLSFTCRGIIYEKRLSMNFEGKRTNDRVWSVKLLALEMNVVYCRQTNSTARFGTITLPERYIQWT